MSTDTTNSTKLKPIPLRIKEPQFEGKEWPCPQDQLRRHTEIENLSPVLLNAQTPLVFAIDAPWGGGKTTFFRLWQRYLSNEGKISLYLNAWESDFADDPLLPMLTMLDQWLSGRNNNPAMKSAWEKAKKYTPGIIKSTAVAAAKAATFGALDLDKEFENLAAELTGGAIGDLVDNFNVKQKSLEQFKTQLSKALEALPTEQENLIIFIDELDRCKPTYAIEVLERIKHLFNIERLVFVLAINRDQLSKSLQGVYGPSFDGLSYLKRFIDLDYQLNITDLDLYIHAKIQQPDILEYFHSRQTEQRDYEFCSEILKPLAKRFRYSLRDIDQFITRLRLILRSIPKNHYLDAPLLIPLIVLRHENPDLYRRYADSASYANEVTEFILNGSIGEISMTHTTAVVAGYLIAAGRNPHEKLSLDELISPWKNWLGRMKENDPRYSDVQTVIRLASDSREFFAPIPNE